MMVLAVETAAAVTVTMTEGNAGIT